MHHILGITVMLWQRMSQRPWTCTWAYRGEISPIWSQPLPSNFLNISISFCRRDFFCWTVTKSRHRHLPGSCLCCRCFTVPHLPPCAESAFCTSTPRAAIQREKRLWIFKKTTFPTPSIIYSIPSCQWFYCSCSFHGMMTKWRSDNNGLNSWWQFWSLCLSCWVLTCAISCTGWVSYPTFQQFLIMAVNTLKWSCKRNCEHNQGVMADVSLEQESVGADSLTQY